MKRLLSPVVGLLSVFVCTQSLSSEAPVASGSISRTPRTALSLEATAFEFPGAGERNNNRMIGDFCCTGETATVRGSDGTTVGYIYFHDFDGGINTGARSAAIQFGVLVSGTSNLAQPKSVREKSSIEFAARELKPGLTRGTIAGVLQFTATILDVQFVDEAHSRYWMDSIRVKIDVQQAPPAQSARSHPDSSPVSF